MAIEIGSTVEGTIVKLADYGAVVRLSEGKVGLVHISEIADTYVRDVRDYFCENDRVFVKVLKLNDKGRYELSTKQVDCSEVVVRVDKLVSVTNTRELDNFGSDDRLREATTFQVEHSRPATFEDRLTKFLKDSEERQTDLKRHVDAKRGSRRK